MTLDMSDEGTSSLKMTTARSVRFSVNLGLGQPPGQESAWCFMVC